MTHNELRKIFNYHPDGYLVYKVRTSMRTKPGTIVKGSLHHRGYLVFKFKEKTIMCHRAIYLWHNKKLPKQIDHINRIKTDNRIENLRDGTVGNSWNASHKGRNKLGFKGLCFDKKDKLFYGAIQANGKRIKFCFSKDKNKVIEAIKKKRAEMHKEFACDE